MFEIVEGLPTRRAGKAVLRKGREKSKREQRRHISASLINIAPQGTGFTPTLFSAATDKFDGRTKKFKSFSV